MASWSLNLLRDIEEHATALQVALDGIARDNVKPTSSPMIAQNPDNQAFSTQDRQAQIFSSLRTIMEKACNAFAPVNRMNDDLLRLIFSAFSELNETPRARRRAVLTLASVCRQWRTTALEMSSLWVYFSFQDLDIHKDRPKYAINSEGEVVPAERDGPERTVWADQLFLSRAGLAPLVVQLSLPLGDTLPEYGHDLRLPDFFPHLNSRMRKLVVHCRKPLSQVNSEIIWNGLRPSHLILEDLEVVCDASDMSLGISPIYGISFPQLRSFSYHGATPYPGIMSLSALRTLHQLSITSDVRHSPPILVEVMLSKTSALRSLSIKTMFFSSNHPYNFDPNDPDLPPGRAEEGPVCLLHLRRLSLNLTKWSDLPLDKLSAPSLAALSIVLDKPPLSRNRAELDRRVAAFLDCSPPLEEVSVGGLPSSCVLHLLALTPRVAHLRLLDVSKSAPVAIWSNTGPYAPDRRPNGSERSGDVVLQVLESLKPSGDIVGSSPQIYPAPLLEELTIPANLDVAMFTTLLSFLEARARGFGEDDGGASITHVRVGTDHHFDPTLLEPGCMELLVRIARRVKLLDSGEFYFDTGKCKWVVKRV